MDSLPNLQRGKLYEVPGNEDYIHGERFLFLALIAELVPDALTNLASGPLTQYRAIEKSEAISVARHGSRARFDSGSSPRGATVPSHL